MTLRGNRMWGKEERQRKKSRSVIKILYKHYGLNLEKGREKTLS